MGISSCRKNKNMICKECLIQIWSLLALHNSYLRYKRSAQHLDLSINGTIRLRFPVYRHCILDSVLHGIRILNILGLSVKVLWGVMQYCLDYLSVWLLYSNLYIVHFVVFNWQQYCHMGAFVICNWHQNRLYLVQYLCWFLDTCC